MMLKFILLFTTTFFTACTPIKPDIGLTLFEKEYIRANPTITFVAETAHAPYMFKDGDKLRGMSIDYVRLIERKTGLKLVPVEFSTFHAGLVAVQDKKVDLITTIRVNAERLEYLEFTPPYSLVGGVLVTTAPVLELPKSVSIAKKFSVKAWVDSELPFAKLVEFDNDSLSMDAMLAGAVEAAVMDHATYLWLRQNTELPTSATQIGFDYAYNFAVLKGNTVLPSIIAKALLSITAEERAKINQRWVKSLD